MIKILTDKKEWNSLIGMFDDSDFYHTFDYHQVSKNNGDRAVLIHYSQNGLNIALPLIIRDIEGSAYCDATSVYGYPGPLISDPTSGFDHDDFKKELDAYFNENNVISVFSRLNPFIPLQEYVMEGMGEIVSPGNVINIDLTKTPGCQVMEYHKRLRTYINKSRRLYSIRSGVCSCDMELFMELYHENMRRVEAKPKYFFEVEYFQKLLESNSFESDLLIAVCNNSGESVAAALFIKKNKIVQYHLSGVREDYLKLNPIKLLIDEMRIRATQEGYRYFNLGGGVANKEDSLFQFKQSFSHDIRPFNVWRYVVNRKAYNQLIDEKISAQCLNSSKSCNDFFPCYRCETPVVIKSNYK